MSVQQLLQQLLQSGQGLVQGAGDTVSQKAKASGLGGFGGGALAGGALGLLLGNKKFRKMGGKMATYGGAAALGALALKAYQDWQQSSSSAQQTAQPAAAPVPSAQVATPAALGWSGSQLEQHSKAVLAAMIGAAKADGHIGPQERQTLEAEITRLSGNAADRQWFEAELQKPADPSQVAALASSPEMAAEIYLASLLVCDNDSFMERAYLDELARQLGLDPSLKTSLENRLQAMQS